MKKGKTISWTDEVLRRAYEGNDTRAMMTLARMFLKGDGVERSQIRSLDLYAMARMMGHRADAEFYQEICESIKKDHAWKEELEAYLHLSLNLVSKEEDPFSVRLLTRLLYSGGQIAHRLGCTKELWVCWRAIIGINPDVFPWFFSCLEE